MADLSHLGGLNPVETMELDDNYVVTKEKSTFQQLPKGRYTLRAPDAFPDSAFSRTKAGSLQVQVDPTIVGPVGEGTTVKFVKVSAKVFDRNGAKVSQVGDYLKANGFRGVLKTEADIADAVESTAGQVYEALLDWTGYSKTTQFRIEGMEKFPKLADGSYQSWIDDPTPGAYAKDDATGEIRKDKEGNPMKIRVFANLTVPFGGWIPKQ